MHSILRQPIFYIFLLGAITYVATLVGVYAAGESSTENTPVPVNQAQQDHTTQAATDVESIPTAPQLPRFIGFALGAHHMTDTKAHLQAIDNIKAMGCNAILILTPAYQKHGGSTEITIDPKRCPTRAQLEAILRHAVKRELHVTLMPIVLFSEPRGNEWRGKIRPEDWDTWWKNYSAIMVDFAKLAESTGVSCMTVGSELLSTERQAKRWSSHIAAMRKAFSGKLTYSTNWDHYTVPVFWHELDAIGINGYWKLTDDPNASDADLTQRWTEIREQVMTFSKKIGKPVLLTEIGYPSLPWGLKDPWNYIANGEKADPTIQLRAYKAFLSAWQKTLSDQAPAWSRTNSEDGSGKGSGGGSSVGVFIYEWDIFHKGGPKDTGYGVRGKPTYDLLKEQIPAMVKSATLQDER